MIDNIVRGLYTDVIDIRRKVYADVARTILNNDHYDYQIMKMAVSRIPYQIISKADPTYRCCVYKERAIVTQRIRLALGLSIWEGALSGPVYVGIENVLKPVKNKSPEIIKVIPEACEKCPVKAYKVTDNCRNCMAHPCSVVCPVDAVYFNDSSAVIDQDKCIKCGRCQTACPYRAITNYDRPCAAACGVDAIESDDVGRAKINYDKCVNCGMCLVSCPFGAIGEKSEFAQILIAIKEKKAMYAIVAPSFAGQFGPLVTPGKIITAIEKIGFKDVKEVAYGADAATLLESREWHHKIYEEKQAFLGTSCCTAWVDMAKMLFPGQAQNISESFTPMVETAKYIKNRHPGALITFIGPCTAKKAESLRKEVSPFVDFVMTFEELASIFVALDIDLAAIKKETAIKDASGSGRNYAVSGGVAEALKEAVNHFYPGDRVKIAKRDSLKECRKMMALAKAGKLDANLLEGMACPNGCVGGAGILAPMRKTIGEVGKFAEAADFYPAHENPDLSE